MSAPRKRLSANHTEAKTHTASHRVFPTRGRQFSPVTCAELTIRLSIPLFAGPLSRLTKRVGISTRFSRRVPAARMGCCVVNGPVPQTLLIRPYSLLSGQLYRMGPY